MSEIKTKLFVHSLLFTYAVDIDNTHISVDKNYFAGICLVYVYYISEVVLVG